MYVPLEIICSFLNICPHLLSSRITDEICDVTQQCFILGHYCIIIRNIMKFVLHYISYKLTRMQFSHSYTSIIKTLWIVFPFLSRKHIVKLYSFYTWKYFNQTLASSLKFSLSFRNSFILYDFGIYQTLSGPRPRPIEISCIFVHVEKKIQSHSQILIPQGKNSILQLWIKNSFGEVFITISCCLPFDVVSFIQPRHFFIYIWN